MLGVTSIIPVLLVVFVPALLVWKDDFPHDYEALRLEAEAL